MHPGRSGPSFQPQHGFTLTEMLIALVVFAIGVMGLARMTISTINANALNRRLITASALVQDRMESLKQAAYAGTATGISTEGYGTIPSYSAYQRVTTVVGATPATNMKTVTVTVSWPPDHSVSAITLLAE